MATPKTTTIAVFGATGQQGGSVIRALVLHNQAVKSGKINGAAKPSANEIKVDPSQANSEEVYHIRALTRDPNSTKAKGLLEKYGDAAKAGEIELVKVDSGDEGSLKRAFEGADVIFAVTDFISLFAAYGGPEARKIEEAQAIKMAHVAASTPTLKHYIWSSIPSAAEGYVKHFNAPAGSAIECPHADGKASATRYITTNLPELAKKTTFMHLGIYANVPFTIPPVMPTYHPVAKKHIVMLPTGADVLAPWAGDTEVNAGVFVVRGVLGRPQLSTAPKGRDVLAVVEWLSMNELLKLWVKAEKEIEDKDMEVATASLVSLKEFDEIFPGFGQEVGSMFVGWGNFGPALWKEVGGVDGRERKALTMEELDIEKGEIVGMEQGMKRAARTSAAA